jgi:predicted Zn-ribbon and HTH transcriptional regulator
MKFTLKVQLDTASELARFIQDMNMEIDMPFLTNGVNETYFAEQMLEHEKIIKDLTNQVCIQYNDITRLNAQLQNLSEVTLSPLVEETKRIIDFMTDNPLPEQDGPVVLHNDDIVFESIHDANDPEPEPEPKKETLKKIATGAHATHVMKPKPCATCGTRFVPYHNRVQSCDTCRSKKVKAPHKASD